MRSTSVAVLLLASLAAGPLVPANVVPPNVVPAEVGPEKVGPEKVASAQVAPEGDGYRIRVKYAAGEKTRYAVTTEMVFSGGPEGMPTPPKTEVQVEQEVLSVEKGIATVKIVTTGGPGGTPSEQTVEIDERGQVVSKDGGPYAGFPSSIPDRAVKPGEEWSAEVELPGAPNGEKTKVDYKFVGLVEADEKKAARIDFKMAMAGETTMDGEGTVLLDMENGQLLRTTTKLNVGTNLPTGDRMTIAITMEMKRL